MIDPEFDKGEPGWESGLAATLIGGFLLLTAAIGIVFNIQVAEAGPRIMDRTDARLHAILTVFILGVASWTIFVGLKLAFRGRGPLAASGRSLGFMAAAAWAAFALGQTFVLVPRL
jgi:hypothetical protein